MAKNKIAFKKTVIIALIAVVLIAALTGCTFWNTSENGADNSNSDNSPTYNTTDTGVSDTSVVIESVTLDESHYTSSLADMVERVQDSVVSIKVVLSGGTSSGSGVIISVTENYAYILTCQHVVDDAQTITAYFEDGTESSAYYVGGLEDEDIAVIKIAATDNIVTAKIRNLETSPLRTGEDAIAIGNARGVLQGSVTKGIVSGVRNLRFSETYTTTSIQTDAAINQGNSGGALFDANGLLIGIVNAKLAGDTIEGIGLAIPIDIAIDYAATLIETAGASNNPYGGLGYIPGKFTIGINLTLGASGSSYIYLVNSVSSFGSCYNLLNKNDRISAIDGVNVTQSGGILDILSNKKIGDSIVFKVTRQDFFSSQTGNVTVILKQYVCGYSAN